MADANKEEQASKVQALAEKCFLAGNVFGARQWMQSAVRLAPDLPGTAQAVAAYDVHVAAPRRPPDWYAVLGLQPGPGPGAGPLTHDDIKRQHRRLCLLVHPDKNPCAAADSAFKLVQAAWHALSARHPPGAAAVANQPPPPPPPRPQPQRQAAPPRAPEPQPRPRPQVVQMPRRAPAPATPRAGAPTMPSYVQQASRHKPLEKDRRSPPMPPTAPRSTSPIGNNKCPACGACTPNGLRSSRCGSCLWSPMDDKHDDDDFIFEDDDY